MGNESEKKIKDISLKIVDIIYENRIKDTSDSTIESNIQQLIERESNNFTIDELKKFNKES
jgi:hypothetical protein